MGKSTPTAAFDEAIGFFAFIMLTHLTYELRSLVKTRFDKMIAIRTKVAFIYLYIHIHVCALMYHNFWLINPILNLHNGDSLNIWASAWDFQQCDMSDQQRLRPACAYAQSDQSICLSLEYSMTVKLPTAHHLEFLSFKGAAEARLSLHLSKCQVVGNLVPRLIWFQSRFLTNWKLWEPRQIVLYRLWYIKRDSVIFSVPFI